MKRLALALSILAAACGGNTLQETGGTTSTGAGGQSSTSSTGAGASGPEGKLCDDVTVPGTSCPVAGDNYHNPLISFVRDSTLIFKGTVTALHELTPGLGPQDTSRSIVVQVDTTLYNGGQPDVTGQKVTVFLLAAPTMAVGYQGYFFTQEAISGQSEGVKEISHVDPGVYPTIESDVPGIETLLAEQRLYARMQTAGSVIVGTVSAITPLMSQIGSEHDPVWAKATITADCTLRGATPASADAVFATSQDIAWYTSPKLTVGQQGVFLLQPAPSPPGPFKVPDGIPYTITDRLDAHPLSDRAHIALLVLCPPNQE